MSSDSPADKSNPNGTQPGDLPLLVTEVKPSLNPDWGNKSRRRNPRAETSLHWQDVLTQTCSSNVKPNLTTSCYWLKWWVAGQVHYLLCYAGWQGRHRKSSCLLVLPNQSNDGLLLTSTQGQGRSWSTANDIHFERPLYLSTCTGSLFCPRFHVWSIFQLSLWEEVGNDEAGVSTLHPLLPLLCLLPSYLIFVISFTQTGFSKTKFYTQKND